MPGSSDDSTIETLQRKILRLEWRIAIVGVTTAIVTFVSTVLTVGGGVNGLIGLFTQPKGQITSPSPNEPSVPKTFRLSGTATGIDANNVIWGLSRRHDDGKFYPMEKPCVWFDKEDTFDCGDLYLGNQEGGDVGAVFDLLIVEADVNSVVELQSVQIANKNDDQKKSLDQLPSGAKLLNQISVTRTEK